MRRQRLETGPHRALPGTGAVRRRRQIQAFHRAVVKFPVVGVNHRLDDENLVVAGKGRKHGPDHGLAENMPVLLGQMSACAMPASGCYNHRCDLHAVPSSIFIAFVGLAARVEHRN